MYLYTCPCYIIWSAVLRPARGHCQDVDDETGGAVPASQRLTRKIVIGNDEYIDVCVCVCVEEQRATSGGSGGGYSAGPRSTGFSSVARLH